jgi:hypothetical protein
MWKDEQLKRIKKEGGKKSLIIKKENEEKGSDGSRHCT